MAEPGPYLGGYCENDCDRAVLAGRIARLAELCDERDGWLIDDFGPPESWPAGTVHQALVTTAEIRELLGVVRSDPPTEESEPG